NPRPCCDRIACARWKPAPRRELPHEITRASTRCPPRSTRDPARGPLRMSSLRIPMFVKFLVGCLTLAALLIVGGTFVFRNETQRATQGNSLAKHLRRYQGYEEQAGRGLTGALEMLAEDPRLRAAIAGHSQATPAPPAASSDSKAAAA